MCHTTLQLQRQQGRSRSISQPAVEVVALALVPQSPRETRFTEVNPLLFHFFGTIISAGLDYCTRLQDRGRVTQTKPNSARVPGTTDSQCHLCTLHAPHIGRTLSSNSQRTGHCDTSHYPSQRASVLKSRHEPNVSYNTHSVDVSLYPYGKGLGGGAMLGLLQQ